MTFAHRLQLLLACSASLLLALAGCEHYTPQPLTSAAVEQALTVPSGEILRERVDGLHNPLLRRAQLDDPLGLTPDAIAVLAAVVNPATRADRNRANLAAAQLFQAGILPNPQLDLTIDPVTGGNTLGTVTGYLIGLDYDIVLLITRNARLAASRATNQSVRLDVAWQEWLSAQSARKAAYDLLSLRQQASLGRQVDAGLAQNLDVIRRAVAGHEKTLLDLAAAQSASDKAHSDLLATLKDLAHQELALRQAVGAPSSFDLPLREMRLPSTLDLPSREVLLRGLEERRLDLLALKRGYESQEQTVRAAVLAQFPKIVLNLHQASDTTNVHTTGAGVTLDLPIFDHNQGSIAIERATREKLFDEYTARVFDARSTLDQSLADIRNISAQIADAQGSIPALERLVQAYQLALGQGNVDVLSYYSARNDLASRRLDVLRLQQQLLQSKIALELAAGCYVPDPPEAFATTRPALDAGGLIVTPNGMATHPADVTGEPTSQAAASRPTTSKVQP